MDKEELQDAKQEQDALKTAKETAKREGKKQVQKIVWNAVKAAVIPMLLMLAKIMLVVILVCMVASLFSIVVNSEEEEKVQTSTEEVLNPAVSMEEFETDITAESYMVSYSQIVTYIKNYESENEKLKSKMVNDAMYIEAWQNNYGYSALFLVTEAFEQGLSDDEFNDFLTNMGTTASLWKNSGYKTIKDIAQAYVGDATSEEWKNKIEERIHTNSEKAGIKTYGEYAEIGNGYNTIYIRKDGKIFRNYKQTKGYAINNDYCMKEWFEDYDSIKGENTIDENGCSLVATTVVISGYKNIDLSPYTLAKEKANHTAEGGMVFRTAFATYGLAISKKISASNGTFNKEEQQEIKEELQNGNAMIIKVEPPSNFTKVGHYMTLLDYSASNDAIYVSNPAGKDGGTLTGWLNASYVLQSGVLCLVIGG